VVRITTCEQALAPQLLAAQLNLVVSARVTPEIDPSDQDRWRLKD
jgi:hypothetical protein